MTCADMILLVFIKSISYFLIFIVNFKTTVSEKVFILAFVSHFINVFFEQRIYDSYIFAVIVV